VIAGAAAGATLAAVAITHALYEGDWHEWSAEIPAGGAVRQVIALPPGWRPPPGSRGEVRLYLAGSPSESYVPVIRVDGQEAGRLGPGFTWVGPLRGVERFLQVAAQQGKRPAEVPRWYAAGFDAAGIVAGRIEVELAVEPVPGAAGEGRVRIWGDFAPRPGLRVYEGPAVYSRFPGADVAFHKFVTTGHYGLWRWTPLLSPGAEGAWRQDAGWRTGWSDTCPWPALPGAAAGASPAFGPA
jgi:hypothetical protein